MASTVGRLRQRGRPQTLDFFPQPGLPVGFLQFRTDFASCGVRLPVREWFPRHHDRLPQGFRARSPHCGAQLPQIEKILPPMGSGSKNRVFAPCSAMGVATSVDARPRLAHLDEDVEQVRQRVDAHRNAVRQQGFTARVHRR